MFNFKQLRCFRVPRSLFAGSGKLDFNREICMTDYLTAPTGAVSGSGRSRTAVRHLVRRGFVAAVVACAAAAPGQVSAQGMPTPYTQEVLVKSMLVTISDAVLTDNFTVLEAKISKPFRDQFPIAKLRAIFKDLVDKHAAFDAVVAKPIIQDAETRIDANGILRLKGHFETAPKQFKYQLGFMPSDGEWKLSAVAIDIE
jgi:hypothetical protein